MAKLWGDVNEIVLARGTCAEAVVKNPLALIVGYAFAKHSPLVDQVRMPLDVDAPPTGRARWGYRTYDCIPASEGFALTGVDLTVAAGLNARMNVDRVGALQAVAELVGESIEHLEAAAPFWEMDRDELHAPSATETYEWWAVRAWSLLMSQPDVGVAVTHKTLHHKRPKLFPLLDGVTKKHLPKGRAWATIHDDLTSQAEAWAQLEDDFRAVTDPARGDIELTRLRLHDILLWLTATGEDDAAKRAGLEWRKHHLR